MIHRVVKKVYTVRMSFPPQRLLGLYLHSPFCLHKCGYCDFNSWAETRRESMEAWWHALQKQMDLWSEQAHKEHWIFDSLFFGGGTPSLLPNDILVELGKTLSSRFSWTQEPEWNLEANPETLDREKIQSFKEAGFSRLSVGIQSFQDKFLERLERRARQKQNLEALENIQTYWDGRWSLDLMFGLPEQTLTEWFDDLNLALTHNPSHLSAYQLTLSTSRSQSWLQGNEEELLNFFNATEDRLESAGLARYEVSNFSRPNQECRHNLRYWKLLPFLGLGPGAAGILPFFEQAPQLWGSHQKNPDSFETWVQHAGAAQKEFIGALSARNPIQHYEELLMMGLRLADGIDLRRFGNYATRVSEELSYYVSPGWMKIDKNRALMTPRGLRILDGLIPQLFKQLEPIFSNQNTNENWDFEWNLEKPSPK